VSIIDDLLRDLARTLAGVPDETARSRADFIRACLRADENPAEQQRIDDMADLLEAEEALYAQARAAADRGDLATAIPLLRQCAEAGTGEAAWLLAQLLEETGDITEAMIWYQRARDDGYDRADEKLAALRARPCPDAALTGSPREGLAAAAGTPRIFVSHMSEPTTLAAAALRRDLLALYLIALLAPHHGRGRGDGLLSVSAPPVLIFSDPDFDHFASPAETCRALFRIRSHLVHGSSWVRESALLKGARWLQAREPTLSAEWVLPHLLLTCAHCDEADKSRTAATWALPWRLDSEDYGRPCPANMGRYLAAAGRGDARLPGREPVVGEMMLPPSEVPECRPDTTVAQALELLVQSGTQALPVCEMTRVTGIVTLADLARHISDHQGVPGAAETVRALMRQAVIVPPGTPLPAIARAIADDGIIVVASSGDQPDGYLTAESLLTQAPPGTSARPPGPDRPPLLIPGTGAVLLNRGR